MAENINTEIGKIYCSYNEEKDDFDMMRLIRIDQDNGNDDSRIYVFRYLDDNFHIITEAPEGTPYGEIRLDLDEVKKNYTILQSDGIISLTNIVAAQNETRQIKDVLAIAFPNNKYTGLPDAHQPYIVARQAINNIYAEMEGRDDVGMSVSLDTLPVGYALSDFMDNCSVIGSHLCHYYKTDSERDLAILLDNDDSTEILKDLFDHRLNYKKNTIDGFELEVTDDTELDGYTRSIEKFLLSTQFMYDLHSSLGIIPLDFKCTVNKPLTLEEKYWASLLLGGVHIDKAVPLKFDYTINMELIKMKYFMAIDIEGILYLIPYTESPDEIDGDSIYKLTEEATIQLQERLSKCVKAYGKVATNPDDLKLS